MRPERRSAAARWRKLALEARTARERREARLGVSPLYEGRRAQTFAALTGIADETDPFFKQVREAVGAASTVLDVGAGSGRYALALAPFVADVVAVDPSEELLETLRRQARDRGLRNVRAVHGRWEDVEPVEADVSVCYGVMGHVNDAAPFFRKLDACTRERVFVGIAAPVDVIRAPLWRYFHDEPPSGYPAYLDALAVLRELGFGAQARAHERPSAVYGDIGEAVQAYTDLLELPDSPAIHRELEDVLSTWLVRRSDGRLRQPLRTYPYVTITWRPPA